MYGKFRRIRGKFRVAAANPENITIVLKRPFAEALHSGKESTELDALRAVVSDHGLNLKNYVQEAKSEQVKIAQDEDLNKFEKKVFGYIIKRSEKLDRCNFGVKVNFNNLQGFLDDLTQDTVSPAINRVYTGNTRVL